MPVLTGFVGSAYRSQGGHLDCQELYNWYLERAESREARGPQQLLPCPGFDLFCELPTGPVRAIFDQNGRTFAIGGELLYEIDHLGNITLRAQTTLEAPDAPTVTSTPLPTALDAPATPIVQVGGLPGEIPYGYQITAKNEYGETLPSVEGTTTLGAETLNPLNYLLVTWSPVTGATHYVVYRTTGGSPSPTRLLATVPANTLQYIDAGAPGESANVPTSNTTGGTLGSTTYGYQLTAVIGVGESAASPEGTTLTGQLELSSTKYNELTWSPVADAVSYNIYRTTGGVSPPRLIGSVAANPDLENTDDLTFRDIGAEGESVSPPTSSTAGVATIDDDGAPVQIFSSGSGGAGKQLLLVGGGGAYCYDLATNRLAKVVENATSGGYIGTYFVVLVVDGGTSTMQCSESDDGFTWDPLQIYQRQIAADSWLAMAVTHAEIWLAGSETTEVWVETGIDAIRFAPVRGVFLEQGIMAPKSFARVKGSLVWVAQNKDGAGSIYRTEGYQPVQISTRGIERELEALETLADAHAWTYEQEGHTFYVVSFPHDDVTWCYDTLTLEWHKRGYWNPNDMHFTAYRPQCHAFAFGGLGFGTHLVGDRLTGRILRMSVNLGRDVDGVEIRRMRVGPHLLTPGQTLIFYDDIVIDFDVGLGVEAGADIEQLGGFASGPGENPFAMLQYSDDSGKTWRNEHWRSAGRAGIYHRRVKWNRMGSARMSRVWRLVCTDPIPWRVAGAHWNGQVTAA